MRRLLLLCAAISTIVAAADLPITGLAYVRYKVSDLEKAKAFYTGVLGYEQAFEQNGVVAFQINDSQFVEIAAGLGDEDERLDHVAFEVSDLYTMRVELNRRGVPAPIPQTTPAGDRAIAVNDPDGHRILFVQYMPGSMHRKPPAAGGGRRISSHLMHTGVSVEIEARSMAFYRDKLGFQEIWRGGPEKQPIRWINLKAPGGRGDYIELMLHDTPPTRQQLGSMHHICLEVPAIQAARKEVMARGVKDAQARIGRNRRRQLNLFDPDGTRTELMEPKAVD
ncbi:MAG: VOC family protein [Bryobacterales bacterium]|nr:VOC family protein [Bryobacterales bacterium]